MSSSKLQYTLALSLLKELSRDEEENFVVSPLSLGMALAMLTDGLRGETQTELLQLFGATDENELHSMYSTLLSEKNLPLKLANKYLATVNMRIHPKFESLLKVSFRSALGRACGAPNPLYRRSIAKPIGHLNIPPSEQVRIRDPERRLCP